MKTNHTPGPWRIAKRGASTIEIVGPHGGTIAHMDARLEDKARLIAAAPDLLAALESFLRAPSVGSKGPGSVTIEVQTFNLNAARAAIAKATGGAA